MTAVDTYGKDLINASSQCRTVGSSSCCLHMVSTVDRPLRTHNCAPLGLLTCELNLDLISSTMSWSVPSRGSSCLLHHANLLHEASMSHGRVIYHLPPSSDQETALSASKVCHFAAVPWSGEHRALWSTHPPEPRSLLCVDTPLARPGSDQWSPSYWEWKHLLAEQQVHLWLAAGTAVACSFARSLCLDSKCFLLDDRLLFPEQGTLTDQVKVVGIGLHSDSRDARSSPFLILSFHLCSPMGVNTGELRQMKSLIRALHTSQMLSAPTGILDQGRPWHTADHQPRWWNCTGAASHIQPISSAVEAKLQPIGILTKCIRWWSCHEPQLHMTKGVVERHHDTTFWNGIDPATHFPGDGTDPPSLKHCDHERGYEGRLLQEPHDRVGHVVDLDCHVTVRAIATKFQMNEQLTFHFDLHIDPRGAVVPHDRPSERLKSRVR